jgi:hypothetical protein
VPVGVLLAQVVGRFPLVDEVLRVSVVQSAVVVVDPLADLQVSEPDASRQASEVVDGDIVLFEEVEHFVGVWVREGEDLFLGESGVVAAVADGSGVVVTVRPVEEHIL